MSYASRATVRSPSSGPATLAYRILLVEDDDAIRQLSAKVLDRAGYEVDTAVDGLSGWVALRNHRYDLLITDNEMPGLSGFEMVRNLRSARMTLPVVLASGGMAAEQLNRNQWLQPAVTLPKPFTTDEILNTVAEILPASASVAIPGEMRFPPPAEAWCHAETWPHWGINE